MSQTIINEEVREALESCRGVVALETAVMTHGLPRTPLGTVPACLQGNDQSPDSGWDPEGPIHLQVVRQMSDAVRRAGAIPAVTSAIDGVLHVGLDAPQLQTLADREDVSKISTADLAPVMAGGLTGGTTVAGAIAISSIADTRIKVFATGGIGGVHRDWARHPDVSADLEALSCRQIAVVCSGAKVILDVPATFERLEELGIPTIGVGCTQMPCFTCEPDPSLALRHHVESIEAATELMRSQFVDLNMARALLLVQPVPGEWAIPREDVDQIIENAMEEAEQRKISGQQLTPFLLARLQSATAGRSLESNIALLLANADSAGRLATAWADRFEAGAT
ncbi:MAG: pseudouridine-5-phosphate glycosidase [Phycisphaerae bacterium]|nr:pseudouridine-5-phosphate glycosidase [Phycisphaerae bacterium]